MPKKSPGPEMPSTLQRSPVKAQRTYQETLDAAEDTYNGDEARAHRTAFASLKHSFEKVGDHWEPKETKGPSDEQAEQTGAAARDHPKPTAEGVDANASKSHLLDVATRLEVKGRSKMNKGELVDAIMEVNRRKTDQARRQR